MFIKKIKSEYPAFLVDEAQFLTSEQVKQLCRICDEKNIPIMCYGIRTDFRGELFLEVWLYFHWLITLSNLRQYASTPLVPEKPQ